MAGVAVSFGIGMNESEIVYNGNSDFCLKKKNSSTWGFDKCCDMRSLKTEFNPWCGLYFVWYVVKCVALSS